MIELGEQVGAQDKREGLADTELEEAEAGDVDGGGGFLRRLGLIGLQELELPILCGLVTSDPVLLIGDHGTAKTALAECLASALQLKFHAYDASKALFEDIVGFPNPDQLGKGKLDYVPTRVSIWDREFVLVDEISRANPQTQSKWLEIIRSRRLMGEPLENLKFIMAAMNPPTSYEGAMPLDSALAGRFSFILRVPGTAEMEGADRRAVMRSISADDAPQLRDAFAVNISPAPKDNLQATIRRARGRLPEIRDYLDEEVTRYLDIVVEEVLRARKDQAPHLDGRRLGMIRRNLLAALALDPEGNRNPQTFEKIVRASLPHGAVGNEIPDHLYQMAFLEARREVWNTGDGEGDPDVIDMQAMLKKALESTTIEDALPDLAQLGRYLVEASRGAQNLEHAGRVLRRILPWALRSSRVKNRYSSLLREINKRLPANQDSMEAMALVLLTWWMGEQKKKRRSSSSPEPEDIFDYYQKLAGLISSLLGVD